MTSSFSGLSLKQGGKSFSADVQDPLLKHLKAVEAHRKSHKPLLAAKRKKLHAAVSSTSGQSPPSSAKKSDDQSPKKKEDPDAK